MTDERLARTHRKRRQSLLNRLGPGLLIVPAGGETLRNGDVSHEFRPNSDFYYLTGFPEPDAVLVASRVSPRRHRALLFVRPKDKEREQWDGPRVGARAARERYGVSEAFALDALFGKVESLLLVHERLFFTWGDSPPYDQSLQRIFERLQSIDHRSNRPAHPRIVDPKPTIGELRLIKGREELALMRRAVEITGDGHIAAMHAAAAGRYEYEVQAELEAAFRRAGSQRTGYPSIVASGPNACVLHHVSNRRRMRAGELLLIDAGAELDLYTADVTRTVPVSGSFTEPQKKVYRAVLSAQKAAIDAVVPGRDYLAPHRAALRVISQALVRLGVLEGRASEVRRSESYRRWFMHGTSHWLGMDVHDAGGYRGSDGKARRLEPGMVLTVEPGLYFRKDDREVPAQFRGIGIRIEDDILVTKTGHENLTKAIPKEIEEIERLCSL